MTNILIAAHGFPPTHSAGAERRAERMARWLAANGYKTTVFAVENVAAPGFNVETSQQDNFTVHRLHYNVKDGDHFRNMYDYPLVGQAFREVLASERFDLVHVVCGYLLGGQVIHAVREAGLPLVLTLTEFWFMCARLNLIHETGDLCNGPDSDEKCMRCLMEEKRRYRLPAKAMPQIMNAFWSVAQNLPFSKGMTAAVEARQETLKQALEAVDVVICPSQFLKNKFTEYGFDTRRFMYMRQGLNLSAAAALKAERPADGSLRLGYTGQIKTHKGVDVLVDAAIELLKVGHNLSLDVWGAENEEPAYVEMLKERSAAYPTIRWNGRYSGSDVWQVMADFDVMVIPSRWYENSPNAILEAYAMRLPVIGTNLGGMAELIEHEKTGLVFTLNSVRDLRYQIERLLLEPGLLQHLKASIPPVKSIEEEMRELESIYSELMNSNGDNSIIDKIRLSDYAR